MPNTAHQKLKEYGSISDKDINLFECAFLLAQANKSQIEYEPYRKEFEEMVEVIRQAFQQAIGQGESDSARMRLLAMKHIIHDQYRFSGGQESVEDSHFLTLIEVWQRRKATPIILALLCVQAGRFLEWDVTLIKFPTHSICRLEYKGEILLFDPYKDFKVIQAADLRLLLKKILGNHAELSADYYQIMSNREILIRIQNTIKLHQIEQGEYQAALETIMMMRLVSPQEYRLLFDAGVLYAKTHQAKAAIQVLEEYVNQEPEEKNRRMALVILQEIKENTN